VDTCLPAVLVDLEAQLTTTLQRPIAYTVCDSEGGGQPTGQRYAAAGRHYISVLPHRGYPLSAFAVSDTWAPVEGDPAHEAVAAQWADPQRAQADPRQLVLMRRPGDTAPTRVYAGYWPAAWPARSRRPSLEQSARPFLSGQLTALARATQKTAHELGQQIAAQEAAVTQRQAVGQTWQRLAQGVARLRLINAPRFNANTLERAKR
jgi:hypothetical protein